MNWKFNWFRTKSHNFCQFLVPQIIKFAFVPLYLPPNPPEHSPLPPTSEGTPPPNPPFFEGTRPPPPRPLREHPPPIPLSLREHAPPRPLREHPPPTQHPPPSEGTPPPNPPFFEGTRPSPALWGNTPPTQPPPSFWGNIPPPYPPSFWGNTPPHPTPPPLLLREHPPPPRWRMAVTDKSPLISSIVLSPLLCWRGRKSLVTKHTSHHNIIYSALWGEMSKGFLNLINPSYFKCSEVWY